MPSPFFSGRIPQELFDHVEAHRKSTGESKTDILVKALETYTGFESNDSPDKTLPKISEVLERLERVEAHIFKDEKKVETEHEVSNIEKRQYNLLEHVENTEPDQKVETPKNTTQVLITAEAMETVGVSQGALSQWKKKGLLPKQFKGYEIDFSHSETKPRNSFWKVTPV